MKCIIVENDEDDKYITQKFLDQSAMPVHYVSNADELFVSLKEEELPSLILINYNIGPDNGLALLKQLKNEKEYRSIPVVVLCGNNDERTVKESYNHGASAFVRKPDNVEETRKKIDMFFRYWTEVVETP